MSSAGVAFMKAITITELRANLYNIVDQLIQTGAAVEVQCNGHKIKIILADAPSKLERLTPKPYAFNGDPEDIVHCDWLNE